jgi:hypothetical protein
MPNRTVANPTMISAAKSVELPGDRILQINEWTVQSTLTSERAVKASAFSPSTSAKMRLAKDMLVELDTALAVFVRLRAPGRHDEAEDPRQADVEEGEGHGG